jgi:ribosome-associated toxin RatA of RatAB toxin-antitoxin module
MNLFDKDIRLYIIDYLSPKDIYNFLSVNKEFNKTKLQYISNVSTNFGYGIKRASCYKKMYFDSYKDLINYISYQDFKLCLDILPIINNISYPMEFNITKGSLCENLSYDKFQGPNDKSNNLYLSMDVNYINSKLLTSLYDLPFKPYLNKQLIVHIFRKYDSVWSFHHIKNSKTCNIKMSMKINYKIFIHMYVQLYMELTDYMSFKYNKIINYKAYNVDGYISGCKLID